MGFLAKYKVHSNKGMQPVIYMSVINIIAVNTCITVKGIMKVEEGLNHLCLKWWLHWKRN